MSVIPEVKCRRCGTQFSSMRSRCPSCGTRRVAQSGRTPGATPGTVKGTAAYERAETNTKWQMIFGLILVVAVILAIIVMVSTSLNGVDNQSSSKTSPTLPAENSAAPTAEAPPTTEPTPTPSLERIAIMYLNREMIDVNQVQNPTATQSSPTMKLSQDETLHFTAMVYPATIAVDPSNFKWSCEDEDILELTVNDDGSCDVHIIGTKNGGVVVSVEAFGIKGTCRIYCING